ncbi:MULTISPECIES: type I restriction endonuclease subunit R [Methylophaga]|mgnify:CR=1 FL=1|jgi:type I restriction enzyme R subunit|uniref:Type I restriction enzyme endonuclease subunit n=3 Tax=Methylophaga TaxID=40222 RepID=A0ABP3DGW2_9GAMM|nr:MULTISPECIES: type I restriction endonuclease subunit R [Methylophaga]BDZ72330.1 DEAD/DEAH box helicase [Methylophaga marina]BDZ75437.1 DEAD/DEAH box helicase [Methylophaga marina]|tara:strand:+ start:5646 stop:8789 length:3144 start_codon:yes stop_codon:yes gene_type:complete
MSQFTEAKLEQAIIELIEQQGYPYTAGETLVRDPSEVLIREDLEGFLRERYASEGLTDGELETIIRRLINFSSADLYDSNRAIHKLVADGFVLKRDDHTQKDLFIQLIDYEGGSNRYRIVNQLEIEGTEKRIPDGILYINGLPLVVFEFKSAIREQATLHNAFEQLTIRYARDIPELMKYNALCVISDGVNSKLGSLFAPYEFFYSWRKVTGNEAIGQDGINSLHTMIEGLFEQQRLLDVIRHFVLFPDVSKRQEKIVCRYPQFYAATKLYHNIMAHRKPEGDGKGGTYFGATGCGKSYTMLFLTRLLMRSVNFESPTIVLITDRTDLDDQLSKQFTNAKGYIGDQTVISVESRAQLRELLKGRTSGGVFLTTIHKFTEDTELLTDRNNVICISDEAHRSQVNLDQKVRVTEKGVKRTFGFAKYLHDSLPNATYVGFTGTPVDATLDVFGQVVDSYTMTESVQDEITVRIVYEGRAAKVTLDNAKLQQIEDYYKDVAEEGANEYQIEESKRSMLSLNSILGDKDRIRALAEDFVQHYENRLEEGGTVMGKAMFVSSSRMIAYALWKELKQLRPEWFEVKETDGSKALTEQQLKDIKPSERVKMVLTRGKDDPKELWDLLGTKDYRKELDRQFKNPHSNFKIAIVVDMWLTGFDVPFLDTIYIDKPIQRHNVIQTISRVNRKFEGKEKGLVVDYIGIKSQLNKALAHYSKTDETNFEDIQTSVITVKDHLDLLNKMFHKFDASPYFTGEALKQLECLNMAAEYAMMTDKQEKRFMGLVKRLKAAYDICSGSEKLSQDNRDQSHFYFAVRSIVFKLTKGSAPDTAQMNAKVRQMIEEAIKSDGVEEIFKLGEGTGEIDIFDDDYLAKIEKIKLPNTKIKLLQQLLAKAIGQYQKTNRAQAIEFSKRFQALVEKYNERKEEDVLVSNVLEDFSEEIIKLFEELKIEIHSFVDMGINLEEKAFYDILKTLMKKYDFSYPDDKLLELAKAVKIVVDDKAKYTDWSQRDDVKAELKVDLILLLHKFGYPPVDHDEVYKEIFTQAENFKKNATQ